MNPEKMGNFKPESSPRVDDKAEAEKFLQEYESKEVIKQDGLDVTIDRGMIEKVANVIGNENAEKMLRNYAKLPDNMRFENGLTLVIGENAMGKTTLAKAIYLQIFLQNRITKTKLSAAQWGEYEGFSKIEGEQKKEVLDGKTSEGSLMEFWATSGVAPLIADAINVGELPKGLRVSFVEVPGIVGDLERRTKDMLKDSLLTVEDVRAAIESGEAPKAQRSRRESLEMMRADSERLGSTRQKIDEVVHNIVQGDIYDDDRPEAIITFLDEPEVGMDPFRKKRFEKYILDLVEGEDRGEKPESIVIATTNSTSLYESDLPRIDLRFPERGVFRPSEYPGYFEEGEE